jgi:hypothetical protein
MTPDQFDLWFAKHVNCFTGINTWLAKLPRESDTGSSKQGVIAEWRRTLHRVEYEDAVAATEALHDGSEEDPRSFDKHPGAVARIAGKLHKAAPPRRPLRIGEEETFACLLCKDYGAFTCWHPESMDKASPRNDLVLEMPLYQCAVACTCAAGGRWKHLARFNPDVWLPLERYENGVRVNGDTCDPDEQKRLIEFMVAKSKPREWKPTQSYSEIVGSNQQEAF